MDSIKSAASEIWKVAKLQHFTEHGIGHSESIMTILNLILGNMSTMKNKLSCHEIFILLAAAYLHDIGMQSAYHAGLPSKSEYSLEDKKIIRDKHHETSAKMIRESVDPKAEKRINCGLQDSIQPNYVEFIALLSESHRMNKPEISSNLLKDDYLMTGEKIRVRILVSLLRPIENGMIKILFRIPTYYKNSQRKLDEIIFRKVVDSVREQVSEVKNVLWEEHIYLDFEQREPKAEDDDYSNESTLLLMPDDVIDYATEKLTQKSADKLAIRTGTIYWLDGIPQSDDKELRERAFRVMTFMDKERYDDAIDELEETLKVCILSPTEKNSILLNLGNAYYSLSQIDSALKNYNAILELTKKVSESEAIEGKASALGNIGLIYSDKGDLKNALKYHHDALTIHKEIGYKQGEASDLGNIGLIYRAKGDLDNALKYLKDAMKILDRFKLIYGRDIIQNTIDLITRIEKD